MRRLFILIPIISVFLLNAQNLRRESYIDIPTAHYNEGLYVNLNGNFPLKSGSEVGMDLNMGIEASFNQYNATLMWYNGSDFSLNLSYQILKQRDNYPAVTAGMDNLTYRKYISPVGHDVSGIYVDERYNPRPPEVASVYIVATRTFSESFEFTMGLGRGRFIGYGPRSHLLNLDVFFDDPHENIMFGIFGGVKFSVPEGPSFIIETDGRDANLGVQYEAGKFIGTIGLLKLEQMGAQEGSFLTPRINLDFSVKTDLFEVVKKGEVKLFLLDGETGKPLSGILFLKNGKKDVFDIPSTGKLDITLEPKIYHFLLSSPNYRMKKAIIPIRSGEIRKVVVKLRKK